MDNGLQNIYMIAFFGSFGAKSLLGRGKFVCNVNGNLNSLWVNKLFFPILYKVHNLHILKDFYLAFLKRICTRSSWLKYHSVRCSKMMDEKNDIASLLKAILSWLLYKEIIIICHCRIQHDILNESLFYNYNAWFIQALYSCICACKKNYYYMMDWWFEGHCKPN